MLKILQVDSMKEEEDTAGQEGDVEWGEEVDNPSTLNLPITCICRRSREDMAEETEMAVLYPRPQVPAQLHHQHHMRTSLTSLKALPTGTCATHVGLTSKMDIRPFPAPQHGADSTTQNDSRVLTHKNTSTKGGIRAPKQWTK